MLPDRFSFFLDFKIPGKLERNFLGSQDFRIFGDDQEYFSVILDENVQDNYLLIIFSKFCPRPRNPSFFLR